ncbi:hypothetical protein QWY31_00545 [Cytophagales bacterium LB-30]|uniref:Phage tail protein n=1 Tax=Shiella aurantiaca TaxID=3058365 RepID=A0ABT8F0Y7_9BACT|nr:hypothetical protein [Shiella aurantiaca]MDN4163964.1 hypothetical protein [Shiella aurantiaca]
MAVIVKVNETESLKLSSGTVAGFSVVAFLEQTAVNTPFAADQLDLSELNLKCVLKRNGVQETLFQDIAVPLVAISNYDRSGFVHLASDTVHYKTILAHGIATKAQAIVPFVIDLGGVLNLKGGDELIFMVQPKNGVFAAAINSSTSFFEFDVIRGIGVESYIPYIKTESITAGKGQDTFSIGDNVKQIMFVNADKTGVLDADQVIQNFDLSSDKLSFSDTYRQLQAKRDASFATKEQSDARRQTFLLFEDEQDIDQVNIELQFVGANVNTSKNWIVYRSFRTNAEKVIYAAQKQAEHAQENLVKLASK